jgi:hypothetical protein
MASHAAFGFGAALIVLLIILTMIPFVKSMFGNYIPNTPQLEGFQAGQACSVGGAGGDPCPEGFFCNRAVDASGHRSYNGSCTPIYI